MFINISNIIQKSLVRKACFRTNHVQVENNNERIKEKETHLSSLISGFKMLETIQST